MNTDVGVWVWSDTTAGAATVTAGLVWAEQEFADTEAELTRFDASSALCRLNQQAGRGPQPVPERLWVVLGQALAAAHDSGGIYDPTVLPALLRIGYDRSFERVRRRPAEHHDTTPVGGGRWQRVLLDPQRQTVELPVDVALDLGGIAKGWTVDRVATGLACLGPVLVDAGGDLRVIGVVHQQPWPIAVQDPFNPSANRAVIDLWSGALATSSVGGRCWRVGDEVRHHIVDPRTGTSAARGLHTVTVRANSATAADVAAKVVLILGSEQGAEYLRAQGMWGWLTDATGCDVRVGDTAETLEVHDAKRARS